MVRVARAVRVVWVARALRLARFIGAATLVVGLMGVQGFGSAAAASAPHAEVPEAGRSVVRAALWSWPVAGAHLIVRPFIAPATQYSAGHRGIDIAATGDVFAPAAGVVHFSGFVVDRYVLSIAHPGDILSSYEPVLSPLRVGAAVTRGELIGTIEPGHCTELCLHFGVRIHGQYVSPMLFLGGVTRPVLLPTRGVGP